MQPTIADLEDLARGAGEILRAGFGQQYQVHYKGEIDLVTEYDHQSEAYLLGQIRRSFPGHQIFTEESGELAGLESRRWYIDPMDGTVNFAHGVPIFCVSLAYAEDGSVRLGVVYDPIRDECFTAVRGHGAWLNGLAIRASETPDLDHSLLVTGFSYDIRTNPRNNLAEYSRLSLLSQGVRRLGSAALDLCYIAAGRMEGYWELEIKPWDVAAGGLIASEAGAIVTNAEGNPAYLTPPYSILAANRHIHKELLGHLNHTPGV